MQLLLQHNVPLPRAVWLVRLVYWTQLPGGAARQAAAAGETAAVGGLGSPRANVAAGGVGAAAPGQSTAAAVAAEQARAVAWTTQVLKAAENAWSAASLAMVAAAAAASAAAGGLSSSAAAAPGVPPVATPPATAGVPGTEQQQQVWGQQLGAGAGSRPVSASEGAAQGMDGVQSEGPSGPWGVLGGVEVPAGDADSVNRTPAAAAANALVGWQYVLGLAAHTLGEGLVDADTLVEWLAKQWKEVGRMNSSSVQGGNMQPRLNQEEVVKAGVGVAGSGSSVIRHPSGCPLPGSVTAAAAVGGAGDSGGVEGGQHGGVAGGLVMACAGVHLATACLLVSGEAERGLILFLVILIVFCLLVFSLNILGGRVAAQVSMTEIPFP